MNYRVTVSLFFLIGIGLLFISLNYKLNSSVKSDITIKTYEYSSLTIPIFFEKLSKNHLNDFYSLHTEKLNTIDALYQIDINDSLNRKKLITLFILHDLFTSQNAKNCSRGAILNIPYQWHWVTPNPRYEIYFTKSKALLKDSKPPAEFSKYKCYADIDRTPYLFLSDLFESEPKYYSSSCDTFSTFGWCSEREMAFVCLMDLLNYTGKVIAEGNHSWSEFIIPLKSKNKGTVKICITIDNTFNTIRTKEIKEAEIASWKKYYGDSPLASWYNEKAHSLVLKQKINNHIASPKAMNRIENSVVIYLKATVKR